MNPKIHYLLTRCDRTQLLGIEKSWNRYPLAFIHTHPSPHTRVPEEKREFELKNCKKRREMIYGVEVFVCWQTKLFVMGLKVAFFA